jgi:N-acetylmuramoyl-L-alanine amidase
VLQHQAQQLRLTVTRLAKTPEPVEGLAFGKDSLTPAVDIARLPNEWVCFGAIAPANASLSVQLAEKTLVLLPDSLTVELPPNSAVLTERENQVAISKATHYQGCLKPPQVGELGKPEFQLAIGGKTLSQTAAGSVTVLAPDRLSVVEVIVDEGLTRSGPSSDYSRLTPLPKGTHAVVTGSEGDWLRLDYGAWIAASQVAAKPRASLPISHIRGVRARQLVNATEVIFPLQVPVPISVQQGDRTFTLTLHNTLAQTDTIKLNDDPLVARLDWQQTAGKQVVYTFNLKTAQQWGYNLRYEGTSLILTLRHPPSLTDRQSRTPLTGIKILLDPGHGGSEDLGARGPTGYPEKDVALLISKAVRSELIQRGASVVMTREADIDLDLAPRVALINKEQPVLALSLHYNALPDDGDAEATQGIGAFWYQTQAHSLAIFLHNYLVKSLNRPSYGVFWNNLALTRPAIAPTVLLELGFMINPEEFEWITNSQHQARLATAIADGVVAWLYGTQGS